jgi:hypothetical protein
MDQPKKKDNLTDMVEIARDDAVTPSSSEGQGQVTTGEGEVVNLEARRVARRLVHAILKKNKKN